MLFRSVRAFCKEILVELQRETRPVAHHLRFGKREEDDDEDLSEDVLADKEDELQEDDEDEVVRSISEALKKNEDDLEVLDIQDVDDVDDVKRT